MEKQFVIIGLGRFGSSVCQELHALGHEILAIDLSEERVEAMSEFATQTVMANGTDERDLKALGVRNFEHAVVAFGEDLQASVLCTLMLKELGVSNVWVKASNQQHQLILNKVGADRVIQPEKEMGIRVAHLLDSDKIVDYIELSKDYSIIELIASSKMSGKTLKQLNIRAKYNCMVLAIKRLEDVNIAPLPEDEIVKGDILITMGHQKDLRRFEEKGLTD
ncbi:TrkA family potassium uptake protein [Planococcus sp. CPCC 101016]|uniref:potassium channel family protein n=1 Tax=Planococcus sp. CPCC 101016 TaxID=2599617 RepID=UPI0011B6435A|nr:TrkA family potassium uptake protein [Planococcus sp. CPCC 101016]TWT08048.1 TrkA family potassium uptake protein [Planococcus sp. CPCC 101016]